MFVVYRVFNDVYEDWKIEEESFQTEEEAVERANYLDRFAPIGTHYIVEEE